MCELFVCDITQFWYCCGGICESLAHKGFLIYFTMLIEYITGTKTLQFCFWLLSFEVLSIPI